MKSIEQLEAEFKTLMDGEIARMKADFQEARRQMSRTLVVIVGLLAFLVIYENWIYPWLLHRLI